MKTLIFSISFLFLTQFQNHKTMSENVTEVAVYRIGENADFELIVEGVNREIKNFDGFVSREVFQSVNDDKLLVDMVVWESHEQAKKAAVELPKKESLKPFMQSIKKVESFGHYNFSEEEKKKNLTDSEEVFEIVLYSVKPEGLEAFPEISEVVSQTLKEFPGFRSRKTGVSLSESNKFMDFLTWEAHDEALKASKNAEKNPKLAPFFKINEETTLFDHFRKLK